MAVKIKITIGHPAPIGNYVNRDALLALKFGEVIINIKYLTRMFSLHRKSYDRNQCDTHHRSAHSYSFFRSSKIFRMRYVSENTVTSGVVGF